MIASWKAQMLRFSTQININDAQKEAIGYVLKFKSGSTKEIFLFSDCIYHVISAYKLYVSDIMYLIYYLQ
jgi:hypothetical protein